MAPSPRNGRAGTAPPCRSCFTTFELTIPSEGLGTIRRSAGFGVDDRRTTVYLVGAETFTPASRKDGDPFRLITRL